MHDADTMRGVEPIGQRDPQNQGGPRVFADDRAELPDNGIRILGTRTPEWR
jgi:hypothetical protein